MAGVEIGDFGSPDETRAPDKTTVEIVRMGGVSASRMRLEPGWRWSECIRPMLTASKRHRSSLATRLRSTSADATCSLRQQLAERAHHAACSRFPN